MTRRRGGTADGPPGDTVTLVATPMLMASAMTETGGDSNGLTMVLAVVAIAAIISLCLWLFFRRGSINDRAEVDMPLSDSD